MEFMDSSSVISGLCEHKLQGRDHVRPAKSKKMLDATQKAKSQMATVFLNDPVAKIEAERSGPQLYLVLYHIDAAHRRVSRQPMIVAHEWASEVLPIAIFAEDDQDELLRESSESSRAFLRKLLNIIVHAHEELAGVLAPRSDDPDVAWDERQMLEDVLGRLQEAARLLLGLISRS